MTDHHYCSLDLFDEYLHNAVVEDLIKVVCVGNISLEEDGQKRSDHVFGLSKEFTSEILSCVRFTTLVTNPVMKTIIPENVWNPNQHGYPSEFKLAGAQLLMCSNSELYQPPPRVPSQEERLNAAAMLPKSLWLEILSYTHRKCEYSSLFLFAVTNIESQ